MKYERYRLVLYHEIIIDDKTLSDEPIVTEYIVNKDYGAMPIPIVINEMIERLKHYLLEGLAKVW